MPPSITFQEFYQRQSATVYRAALRVTGNAEEAEDVLQTVFMRILNLTPPPLLETISESYLRRAATNAEIDILRQRVGYRSVFLAAGLLLRNPIIPALVMLLWESINGLLPDLLQKLSVLHYLQSICPVPPPLDPNVPPLLRLVLAPAPPTSASVAILGVLGVTALVLYVASRAVRRLEINYGTE